jgi:transcriptional regulator of heat shock response
MPDFGSDDYHRRLRDFQRTASLAGKQIDQEEQIEQLHRENQEMKLFVAGMLQLLVNKGTLTQADVEELVKLVERAQRESQATSLEPTSPDLEAIAAAARDKQS